jgi:hypothetical protein
MCSIFFGFDSEGSMRRITGIVLVLGIHFAAAGSAQGADETNLSGTWDDVTPEQERVGYRLPRGRVPVTFDGSACTWGEKGGRPFRQSLFITVPAGKDRGIDFVTVCSGVFHTSRALFRIEGDTLTIKEGAIDRPRPTELSPVEFDGQNADAFALVYIYKRRAK